MKRVPKTAVPILPLVETVSVMKEKIVLPVQKIVDSVHLLMLVPPTLNQMLESARLMQARTRGKIRAVRLLVGRWAAAQQAELEREEQELSCYSEQEPYIL